MTREEPSLADGGRSLRIAMIGQRGLPATWGGVERHVEELGARLVARGHHVTAYGRHSYSDLSRTDVRGIRLRSLPTVRGKGLEALTHSFQSAFLALGEHYDVVHFHAVGPGVAAAVTRPFSGAAVVQTIHGLDADRSKWGLAGRTVLRLGTWMSARVPHETIVVSQDLRRHYAEVYGRTTTRIPNGVPRAVTASEAHLRERFGLEPGSYLLHVGRLVPEKAADILIEAFGKVRDDRVRLVVAGSSADTDEYAAHLHELARRVGNVDLVGFAGGQDLAALYTHARAYVSASRLEGLPLTLLEAMAYRLPVVVSAIPPHVEVTGEHELPGIHLAAPNSIPAFADALVSALDADRDAERRAARERAGELLSVYDWDAVAEQTEAVYRRAADRRGRAQAR
jgi:glycosyltransferase involved in cell wall biosynthesis